MIMEKVKEIEKIKFMPSYMGSAAVDSGQLMICDPCYIDSQWENEDFEDIRVYVNKDTGDKLQFRVDFENYEQVIPKYEMTMNQLIQTGLWNQVDNHEVVNNFSYNACAKATLSNLGYGRLKFKMGHDGAGIAFRTAHGDGYYPVYQKFDEAGELISVEVVFDSGLVEEYSDMIEGHENSEYPPSQMRIYTAFIEDEKGKIIFDEEGMREDFEYKLAEMKKKFA